MKIRKEIELKKFLEAVDKAKGGVRLESTEGDRFNLKSTLSRYVAIGKIIEEHYNDLELFCDNVEDEYLFYNFFIENPDVLKNDLI